MRIWRRSILIRDGQRQVEAPLRSSASLRLNSPKSDFTAEVQRNAELTQRRVFKHVKYLFCGHLLARKVHLKTVGIGDCEIMYYRKFLAWGVAVLLAVST